MNKSTTIKKYLLLDMGNSCIKAAIYNKKTDKISKYITLNGDSTFNDLVLQGKFKMIDKIIFISSADTKKTLDFASQINAICPETRVDTITRETFVNDIDLSNIDKDVAIGNDILLSAYYSIKKYDSNAFFCLGTVYFCVITKGNKIVSVQFTPNVTTGLKAISSSTSIPANLIPAKYDKEVGLNTPNAFASGAKAMLQGYVDLIAKKYNLNHKKIIISGGESDKYKSLAYKYHFIKYGSLVALAHLVKDKNL